MPRLFWKLFLALWLSIMVFAALMAWVNASLVANEPPDMRLEMFNRSVEQVEGKLFRALERNDKGAARELIKRQPRHIRNHLYVFEGDSELLGRERGLEHLKKGRVKYSRKHVSSRSGQEFDVIVLNRMSPGALLEPGWPGVLHRLLTAGLVSALLSWFLARYLSRPLEQLGRASRKLAAGDLAARVGDPLQGRRDEFGQLARDLDEMAARLQEFQSANRRLLRDVSHELRSPLARMRVALEIARNRGAGVVEGELDRLELESERLETLIDEVLGLLRDSSETSPLRTEEFDLCELLSDLQGMVNYEAPEGSPGVCLQAAGPMPVKADRELIWRAVENLLRNALLHTDPLKGIDLSAEQDESGDTRICVADNGPGLPAQQLERIFEPFYRVQEARDRQSGGHGLGLAIAAAAIRRHRGEITVRNRSAGGLEFCIRLPALEC